MNCLYKGSGAFFLHFFTVSDRSSSDVVNKALFTALTYSIKIHKWKLTIRHKVDMYQPREMGHLWVPMVEG